MKLTIGAVTLGTALAVGSLSAQEPTSTRAAQKRPFDPTRVLTRPLYDTRFGRYETGPVQTEWLSDGRQMRLLQEVRYVDPDGKLWKAPRGWIVNGASIPQACWSITGGPYEGRYRDASVLHDYACDKQLETSRAAALLFYNAMRCSWVPEARAKAMYWAVLKGGPQWGARSRKAAEPTGGGMPAGGAAPTRQLSVAEIRNMLQKIERDDPSLDELESASAGR